MVTYYLKKLISETTIGQKKKYFPKLKLLSKISWTELLRNYIYRITIYSFTRYKSKKTFNKLDNTFF